MFSLLMQWMRRNKILPKISDTERQALEAYSALLDQQADANGPARVEQMPCHDESVAAVIARSGRHPDALGVGRHSQRQSCHSQAGA